MKNPNFGKENKFVSRNQMKEEEQPSVLVI